MHRGNNQRRSGAAVGCVPFERRHANDANGQLRRGLAEYEGVWGEVASRELHAAKESALLAGGELGHLDDEMALLSEELRATRRALDDAAVRGVRRSVMSVGEPRRALGEDGEVRAVVGLVEGRRWAGGGAARVGCAWERRGVVGWRWACVVGASCAVA